MPTYNPPKPSRPEITKKLTYFQPDPSYHYNTPTFNLTLPTNPSHSELIGELFSGIPNVIFHQDIKP